MTVGPATKDLRSAVPSCAKQFYHFFGSIFVLSLERVKRTFVVPRVPEFEQAVEPRSDENIFTGWVDFQTANAARVACES